MLSPPEQQKEEVMTATMAAAATAMATVREAVMVALIYQQRL